VLDVTLSDLLSGLEAAIRWPSNRGGRSESSAQGRIDGTRRTMEVQKLVRRLRLQFAAMDRTMIGLEGLAIRGAQRRPRSGRPAKRQK
jgi:hypothetical protein